jgi:hypothetical protein
MEFCRNLMVASVLWCLFACVLYHCRNVEVANRTPYFVVLRGNFCEIIIIIIIIIAIIIIIFTPISVSITEPQL